MKNKILLSISFLTAALLISSCLKDDIGEDWTDTLKGKMYAEVSTLYSGFRTTAAKPVPDPITYKFMVNIASDQPPTENITLTLAVNPGIIDKYNTIKGTDYKLFPYIQLLDPTVTIKAGTRTAYVHVKVWNFDKVSPCDNVMAPISITQATGDVIVADPLGQGSCMMAFPISNPYEGQYQVDGTFNHPTAGIRIINEVKTLKTINCHTVTTTVGDLGAYELTIDIQANNTCLISGGLGSSQPLIPVTGLPNVYDPATKKFTLNYYYVGDGGNRVIQEVYTRL